MRTLGEAFAELLDSHPPFWEVEFSVELFGIFACEGRGAAGWGGIVFVSWGRRAAGAWIFEGGGDGADNVEAQEAGDEAGAGEGQPGPGPEG